MEQTKLISTIRFDEQLQPTFKTKSYFYRRIQNYQKRGSKTTNKDEKNTFKIAEIQENLRVSKK